VTKIINFEAENFKKQQVLSLKLIRREVFGNFQPKGLICSRIIIM